MNETRGFIFGAGTGEERMLTPPPARTVIAPPAAVPAPRLPEEQEPVQVRDWVEEYPAPADTTLDELLEWVLQAGASDLHLAANAVPRYRLHGLLEPFPNIGPVTEADLRGMLIGIMTDRQRRLFEDHHDVDLAYALEDRARFRVNVFSQRGHVGAVLRTIPSRIRTVEEMELEQAIVDLAQRPRGLVLVTGPTGSGKSTLLAALIDLANRTRKAHIITIEDPIEFTHTSKMATVTQREIGQDTDSFATALRAALREDPDIIQIAELRDLETTKAAIEAAETGHLVFATMHTKSAPETVSRIVNQFPDDVQNQIQTTLASCLEAVISQILVLTADGTGRVPAREVMTFGHDVRALIRQGNLHQLPSVLQSGADRGMHTLDADLARLVHAGQVSLDTALEVAGNQDELKRRTGRRD